MTTTTPQLRRGAIRALLLLLALGALLATAGPAAAAKSCGRQVIDDWYDDGRVDGTYAEHCYDDAIEALPRDVRDYSSAKDDILRALQNRMRGEPAPPATTDPSPDDPAPTETADDPTKTTSTAGGGGTKGPDDPSGGGGDTEAASATTGDSASSVPIPLLILAGLALLLVAAGSAGYVIRRVQARRIAPPAS